MFIIRDRCNFGEFSSLTDARRKWAFFTPLSQKKKTHVESFPRRGIWSRTEIALVTNTDPIVAIKNNVTGPRKGHRAYRHTFKNEEQGTRRIRVGNYILICIFYLLSSLRSSPACESNVWPENTALLRNENVIYEYIYIYIYIF